MKIEIEIPKEYEYDYNTDKFDEFFQRVLSDISDGVLCGRYERETANMLMEALKNSNITDTQWTDREKQLIDDIENAKGYVEGDNELEIDFYDDAWYAHYYNGNASYPLEDYSNEPLITQAEIDAEDVDIYSVFNYCNVAYCG